jgi:hypothetical protein
MIFLNPAVLFGLLAASIPVLIHLLNLRKLKRIEFSTLKFLKELQKNKIRKIKIKQWLLLALRVAIILLIVTAFARPTLEGVSIGGTTSAAKTTALFILDDTFSMSVIDENGSYLNQSKQTLKELLNQLQEGDEVGLMLVSNQPDNFGLTSNLDNLKDEMDKTEVSYISKELNDAIIKTAEVIGKSQNFNKEIYLFSDFQKGRLSSEENISDLSELLNEQVRLYSFDYSDKGVFNVGINQLKVNTQIFEKHKPVKFEASVTNYSGRAVSNLVVSLFLNGERSAQQSVDLNSGETKTVQLEAPAKTNGFIDAFVEIEEDDILQDNKRYTSIYIPERIPVLVVGDEKKDYQFIDLALQPGKSDTTGSYLEITVKRNDQLPGIQLNDFEVVILASTNFSRVKDKLMSFINTGKGLIIFPDSKSSPESFNASLISLGLPSTTGIVNTSNSSEAVEFDDVDFNHPLFEDIFLNKEKKQIESPSIYSYYKINPSAKGKSIINLSDGSSFLSEYSIGTGRVLLFNSAPVLSSGDFPLKGIFAPLINKSVVYLSSNGTDKEEHLAGEPINIDVSARTLPQIKVVRPDNSEELINLNEGSEGNVSKFLSYTSSNLAGKYKFFSGEKILANISVNANPLESVAEYLNENDFEEYLQKINFKGSHLRVDTDENPVQMILQARFGSELWRYFLLAAIILALVEMTVARNINKELEGVST